MLVLTVHERKRPFLAICVSPEAQGLPPRVRVPPQGLIPASIHHEYDFFPGCGAVSLIAEGKAPIPYGATWEIVFMMNARSDEVLALPLPSGEGTPSMVFVLKMAQVKAKIWP